MDVRGRNAVRTCTFHHTSIIVGGKVDGDDDEDDDECQIRIG